MSGLVGVWVDSSSSVLCGRSPSFRVESALFRGGGRLCFSAWLGGNSGAADKVHEAVDRVGAVSPLGAEAPGLDDKHPAIGEAPPGKLAQALLYLVVQRGAGRDVESQLDGRGDLVDVLPTRAGTANELKGDLVLADRNLTRDSDHLSCTYYRSVQWTFACFTSRADLATTKNSRHRDAEAQRETHIVCNKLCCSASLCGTWPFDCGSSASGRG